jgi:hypothetical protein
MRSEEQHEEDQGWQWGKKEEGGSRRSSTVRNSRGRSSSSRVAAGAAVGAGAATRAGTAGTGIVGWGRRSSSRNASSASISTEVRAVGQVCSHCCCDFLLPCYFHGSVAVLVSSSTTKRMGHDQQHAQQSPLQSSRFSSSRAQQGARMGRSSSGATSKKFVIRQGGLCRFYQGLSEILLLQCAASSCFSRRMAWREISCVFFVQQPSVLFFFCWKAVCFLLLVLL